ATGPEPRRTRAATPRPRPENRSRTPRASAPAGPCLRSSRTGNRAALTPGRPRCRRSGRRFWRISWQVDQRELIRARAPDAVVVRAGEGVVGLVLVVRHADVERAGGVEGEGQETVGAAGGLAGGGRVVVGRDLLPGGVEQPEERVQQ